MANAVSVLILDNNSETRARLRGILSQTELTGVPYANLGHAKDWLSRNKPSLVLLRLPQWDKSGLQLLLEVRGEFPGETCPLVVLTRLQSDGQFIVLFSAGADDYLHEGCGPAELLARLKSQIRLRDSLEHLNQRQASLQALVELTQKLASTLDISSILFTVVTRVADLAGVDRCSIVLVRDGDQVGHVVAASDDAQLGVLQIDLNKYPEIQNVLTTGNQLVIDDTTSHPLLDVVRQAEPGVIAGSLALVPIEHDQGPMGVMFLRSQRLRPMSTHALALVRTIANATAIALRNARILESLQKKTAASVSARFEAERRAAFFQRYEDIFESASDGMIVIDRSGADPIFESTSS